MLVVIKILDSLVIKVCLYVLLLYFLIQLSVAASADLEFIALLIAKTVFSDFYYNTFSYFIAMFDNF